MIKKECGIKDCKIKSNIYLYGGFALCPKHAEIAVKILQKRSKTKQKSKGISDSLNQIIKEINKEQ